MPLPKSYGIAKGWPVAAGQAADSGGTPVNAGLPVITGTTTEGQTLTSSTGSWTNGPTSYAYQWFRGASPIIDATASTHLLVPADVGSTLTVSVTATNASGALSATSAATATIATAAILPANTVLPAITGTATEGQTLTASTGTWSNSPTSYAYQWKRGGVAISGSINSTRILTVDDVGAVMTVTVTATNAAGSANATSAGTSAVAAASTPVPVNTVLPAVTGTAEVGETLTTTNGTWTNSPSSYAYQWRRDGVNIGGATASTYLVGALDAGTDVTCRVTATNAGGDTPATSNAISIPEADAVVAGEMISAASLTFSGSPYFILYDWRRDGVSVGVPVNENQYFTDPGDAGVSIDCVATARYVDGSTDTETLPAVVLDAPAAFSLALLPADILLDHDPAANLVSTDVSGTQRINTWASNSSLPGTFIPDATGLSASGQYKAGGWDGTLPSVFFNASSTVGNAMVSDEGLMVRGADIMIRRRGLASQPSVATTKKIYRAETAAGLAYSDTCLRASTDAAQSTIEYNGLGDLSGSGRSSTQFGKGEPLLSVQICRSADRLGSSNEGTPYLDGTGGATTTSVPARFGANGTDGAIFEVVRRLKLEMNALKGTTANEAYASLVASHLAWEYGPPGAVAGSGAVVTAGTSVSIVDRFPAAHPYNTRPPNANDLVNSGRHICINTAANSLGLGWIAQFDNYAPLQNSERRISIQNNGNGGATAWTIYQDWDAMSTEMKSRVHVIGDLYTNGLGSGATMTIRELQADMISQIEAAQGVAAGEAAIILLNKWRLPINTLPTWESGGTDSVTVEDDWMRVTYPNYFYDLNKYLHSLGAPGAVLEDATAYGNCVVPTVLQADNTHLTSTGYGYAGDAIMQVYLARGYYRL